MPDFVLPNRRVIACSSPAGLEDVVGEMGDYFRHGIEVRPGDVVFDVGANVGIFALSVFDRCGGDVAIYAFEPIPSLHALLASNAERCDPQRIRTFPYGLSDSERSAAFAYFPQMPVWSSAHVRAGDRERNKQALLRSIETGRTGRWLRVLPRSLRAVVADLLIRRASKQQCVECRLRTCSQVIREQDVRRIDLLKIDVERSELEVLRGIEDAHWPRIRQIVVEVHDEGANLAAIRELLARNRFATEWDQDEVQQQAGLGLLYARRLTESASSGTTA